MTPVAIARSIALQGIDGVPVAVEAHLGSGLVSTTIVGLADAALRESKERVRAALFSCEVPALKRRLTINLSPADLPKTGTSFDLAIAVSMLIVRGFLRNSIAQGTAFAAELGLDGSLRLDSGVLPLVWAAKRCGFLRIIVPAGCEAEARLVTGIDVVACAHLRHLLDAFGCGDDSSGGVDELGWAHLKRLATAQSSAARLPTFPEEDLDLRDLRGQPEALRALAVAAVGGHHMLLQGDHGSGKTMLAERMATILPDLAQEDALALAAIRSMSVTGNPQTGLPVRPPLELLSPDVTIGGLLGGGGGVVRPGALARAHGGVVVIDEAPEFRPAVLEALRHPLETGSVTIRRAKASITYPARFQLVLTANPCPCGATGTSSPCVCAPQQRRRYRSRLSGPLLDRIDIQQEVRQPHWSEMKAEVPRESQAIRQDIAEGRQRSRARWGEQGWKTNAEVPGSFLREYGRIPQTFTTLLDRYVDQGWLSLRGADRVLRLAWSVADLAGRARPSAEDLSWAVDLRTTTTLEQP